MIRLKFILFFVTVFCTISVCGQESMMPNVSYPFLQKLIDSAKLKYPRMRMYKHKMEAAQFEMQKAKMGWFDALTLSYIYNPSTTTSNTTNVNKQTVQSYQPGVFLNVGSILKNPPTIRSARRTWEASQDDLEEYNLHLEEQVKERYFLYVEKLSVLNQRTKTTADAETDLKQVKYKFEKGEETFDNYSKMLVIYTTSIQNKIQLEGDVLIAKSNLEELIVGKLEDIQ